VQTASGFNHAEGAAAGVDGPKELPAQALDHGSGQLMAAAAMLARAARRARAGAARARVARTEPAAGSSAWARAERAGCADPGLDDVQDRLEDSDSAFGRLRAVASRGRALGDAGALRAPRRSARQLRPDWDDV